MSCIQTYTDLLQTLSLTTGRKPLAFVAGEVSTNFIANKKLSDGLLYYGQSASLSHGAILQQIKELKPEQVPFVLQLSKSLNLDEAVTFDLYCRYLLNDFQGDLQNLPNLLKSEEEQRKLTLEILNFYCDERSAFLLSLQECAVHLENRDHPYNSVIVSMWDCLNKDGMLLDRFVKQFLRCQDRITKQWDSEKNFLTAVDASCVIVGDKLKVYCLNDLLELLKFLSLAIDHISDFNFGFFTRVISAFQANLRILSQCDKKGEMVICSDIRAMQTLVALQLLGIQNLMNENIPQMSIPWQQTLDNNTLQRMEDLLRDYSGESGSDCLCLAWVCVRNLTDSSEQYALELNVVNSVEYLKDCLQAWCLSFNSILMSVARQTVYSLLKCAYIMFQEDFCDIYAAVRLAYYILQDEDVASDFWRNGVTYGVGVLFGYCRSLFPFIGDLLLTLCAALAKAGDVSCRKLIETVSDLPTVATTGDPYRLFLRNDQDMFECDQEINLYKNGSVCVPANTIGRDVTVFIGDKLVEAVAWRVNVNGWAVIMGELHLLRQQQDGLSAQYCQKLRLLAEIISAVFKGCPDMAGKFEPFMLFFFDCIHQFSLIKSNQRNDELMWTSFISCFELISEFVKYDPRRSWIELSRLGILPAVTNPSNDPASLASGSALCLNFLGSALVDNDSSVPKPDLAVAFLDLLLIAIQDLNLLHDSYLVGSVVFALRSVFVSFNSWRYGDVRVKNSISYKLVVFLHELMQQSEADSSVFLLRSVAGLCLRQTTMIKMLMQITLNAKSLVPIKLKRSFCQRHAYTDVEFLQRCISLFSFVLASTINSEACSLSDVQSNALFANDGGKNFIMAVVEMSTQQYDFQLAKTSIGLLKHMAMELDVSIASCLQVTACRNLASLLLRDLKRKASDVSVQQAILKFIGIVVRRQHALAEILLSRTVSFEDTLPSANPTAAISSDVVPHQPNKPSLLFEFIIEKVATFSEAHSHDRLTAAIAEVLLSLWMCRYTESLSQCKAAPDFWKNLLSPLLNVDSHHINKGKIRLYAYLFRIIAMEVHFFVVDGDGKSDDFYSVLQPLLDKNFLDLAQFVYAITTAKPTFQEDKEDALHLLSAWRELVFVLADRTHSAKALSIRQAAWPVLDINLKSLFRIVNHDGELNLVAKSVDILVDVALEIVHKFGSSSQLTHSVMELFIELARLACTPDKCVTPSSVESIMGILLCCVIGLRSTNRIAELRKERILLSEINSSSDEVAAKNTEIEDLLTFLHDMLKLSCGLHERYMSEISDGSKKRRLELNLSLIRELLFTLQGEQSTLWYAPINYHSTVSSLIALVIAALQGECSEEVLFPSLSVLTVIASSNQGADLLNTCGFTQLITLRLASYLAFSSGEISHSSLSLSHTSRMIANMVAVLCTTVSILTLMLRHLKDIVLENTIDFVAVHLDFVTEYMVFASSSNTMVDDNLGGLMSLLHLIYNLTYYRSAWRLYNEMSLTRIMSVMCVVVNNGVDALLSIGAQQQSYGIAADLSGRRGLLNGGPEKVHLVQARFRLNRVLATSLLALSRFSPSLHDLGSDLFLNFKTDSNQWVRFMEPIFAHAAELSSNGQLTFAVVIKCLDAAMSDLLMPDLSKDRLPDEMAAEQKALSFSLAHQSLFLLISQTAWILSDSNFSEDDRQTLKRNLGDALAATNIRRYIDRSSAVVTPTRLSRKSGARGASVGCVSPTKVGTKLADERSECVSHLYHICEEMLK